MSVDQLVEKGKTYGEAANGYTDKSALASDASVAHYNVDVAMVNVNLGFSGNVNTDDAAEVTKDAKQVVADYATSRTETCLETASL
jgi:hypothetical protein